MKAVVLPRPGGADVLEFAEIDKPEPRDNEVLVRVRVSAVTRGDVALRRIPRVIVVDLRFQVITSAGAGSAAAIAINADLVLDDVARAVEGRSGTDGSPSDKGHRVT